MIPVLILLTIMSFGFASCETTTTDSLLSLDNIDELIKLLDDSANDPFEFQKGDDKNGSGGITGTDYYDDDADYEAGKDTDTKSDQWYDTAVLEIAYYLRNHKFNDYDRRKYEKKEVSEKRLHMEFPKPPLFVIDTKMRKYCGKGYFIKCLKYLYYTIFQVPRKSKLVRDDDSVAIRDENNWNDPSYSRQMETIHDECIEQHRIEDKDYDPFDGGIARFQWRASASYFMCYYTMIETPQLRLFPDKEGCNNQANCGVPDPIAYRGDFRAAKNGDWECATYSFCPDPCCGLPLAVSQVQCENSALNPCSVTGQSDRLCRFERKENKNFEDMVENKWNVTCSCEREGFKWSSKEGICIDIDECAEDTHDCKAEVEICQNLPGSFYCICRWGFVNKGGSCERNPELHVIDEFEEEEEKEKSAENLIGDVIDKIKSFIAYFIDPIIEFLEDLFK